MRERKRGRQIRFDILFCFSLCRWYSFGHFSLSSPHCIHMELAVIVWEILLQEYFSSLWGIERERPWMNTLESEHCIIWDLKYIKPKEPYFWACSWKGLRRQNESCMWSKLKKNCPEFSLTATFLKLEKVKNVIVQQVSSGNPRKWQFLGV